MIKGIFIICWEMPNLNLMNSSILQSCNFAIFLVNNEQRRAIFSG